MWIVGGLDKFEFKIKKNYLYLGEYIEILIVFINLYKLVYLFFYMILKVV